MTLAPALRFRLPRLLPVTIVVMAAVLVVRSGAVVEAATATAPHEETSAPKPAKPAEPAKPVEAAKPAAAAATVSPPQPAAVIGPPEPVISDSERSLLTDLRQRRLELDRREASLITRETTLAAVDAKLAMRVTELTRLQQRLEQLEADRKSRDEASWRGLVKLYESMKPRDAAVIFNDLDMPVLLPVMDRMKEAKAALIVAAMQPDRARVLTAELSQMRLKSNSVEKSNTLDGQGKAVPVGTPQANTAKALTP